jgi:RNA polymerase-binding protein DksA
MQLTLPEDTSRQLTSREQEGLRKLLLRRREELANRLQRIGRDLARANEPLSQDSADRAVQLENDDALQAIRAAANSDLLKVDQALERLDHGQYGLCDRCHERIDMERLRALPHAVTCAQCAC